MTKKSTQQHCWGFFSTQSFLKTGSCLENVISPSRFFKEKESPKRKRKKAWKLQTFSVFSLWEKALCYRRARSPSGGVAKKQRWRFFPLHPSLPTSKKLNSFFPLLSNLDFPGRFTHFSAAFFKKNLLLPFSGFSGVGFHNFCLPACLEDFFPPFWNTIPVLLCSIVLHRSKKITAFLGGG